MAIVGPNGAGKIDADQGDRSGWCRSPPGRSLIYGQPYAEQRRRVGYVPQRGSVDWDFPTTALDVVHDGHLRPARLVPPARQGRARGRRCTAWSRSGMADFAGRQISQLSGGQQQRVFLARALAQRRRSSTSWTSRSPGVDAATERAIVDLLRELRAAGQDGGRRPPRPGDRARLLRLGGLAQRAPDRRRPGRRDLHAGQPARTYGGGHAS